MYNQMEKEDGKIRWKKKMKKEDGKKKMEKEDGKKDGKIRWKNVKHWENCVFSNCWHLFRRLLPSSFPSSCSIFFSIFFTIFHMFYSICPSSFSIFFYHIFIFLPYYSILFFPCSFPYLVSIICSPIRYPNVMLHILHHIN